jgi:hypothetical protein
VREAEHQRTRLARIDRRLRRTQQALEGQAAARVELDVLAVIPLG